MQKSLFAPDIENYSLWITEAYAYHARNQAFYPFKNLEDFLNVIRDKAIDA